MNFRRRGAQLEEPEINLIPLIDVMLVIIIFLMLTTTYSRYSGVSLNLPSSDTQAEANSQLPNEINVSITADGNIIVNQIAITSGSIEDIASAMGKAMPAEAGAELPLVVISADAKATHQRVVLAMQAAQRAGLSHITFATQNK